MFSELLSWLLSGCCDGWMPYTAAESGCFAKGDRSVVEPGTEKASWSLHSRGLVSVIVVVVATVS